MKLNNLALAVAALSLLCLLGWACGAPRSETPAGSDRGRNQRGTPVPSDSPEVGDGGESGPVRDAKTIRGRVVGVTDGDTVVVFNASDRVQTKVRLATIDCPEKTQDFGVKAKESLSSMVFGKDVEVEVRSIDRYGRTVGVVRVGGMDVNLEQIKRGFAWHYTQYSREQPAEERRVYAEAERLARESRVGLWVDSDPVPPWDYRRARRN